MLLSNIFCNASGRGSSGTEMNKLIRELALANWWRIANLQATDSGQTFLA